MIPGEVVGPDGLVSINSGRATIDIDVLNIGDRPIQVGSHFHFAEANDALRIRSCRRAGSGLTSWQARRCGSSRVSAGPSHLSRWAVPDMSQAFAGTWRVRSMAEISRSAYRRVLGPTAGDLIRLADTELFVEVERDYCFGGDEVIFGGGKVIRESMGQSRASRAQGAADLVITGVVVLDHWGVIKADVGVRDGRIVGIGKAGNPDTMDRVDPALVIGPSTEIISGHGKILTAGAIDCHVHLICPQVLDEAIASGITTIIGGGTGPAEGTKATTVTPGAWNLARMIEATDGYPLNFLFLGKGNTVSRDALFEQIAAGAGGFKLHEDWGTTPAVIDACLRVADESGVQVAIHTDTLNEAGYVEATIAAIAGRSIHTYHTEGAGG